MKTGRIVTQPDEIREILRNAKNIAVLGLSPKPERDSWRVADYLQKQGYRIIPVRPAQKEILGEKAFASVDDLDMPVDILDVFRNSARIPGHVEEAIRLKPRVFWMQLGIEHPDAARKLTEAGIDVIMNRCIKIDHQRLVNEKFIV